MSRTFYDIFEFSDWLLGRDAEAIKTVDEIFANYSDNSDISKVIFEIGEHYWNIALGEAQSQIVSPNSGISEEHLLKAARTWEKLIANLPESDMTAPAYRYAATCYKMIKEYSTALEYYQIVIDNWPDYRPAEHCQIMISKIYKDMRREGVISDYEAEIQLKKAYQNLIEKFPDSVQVGLALDRLEYYEKKDKKLTEAEKFQLISALSSKQAVNKTK